MKKYFLAFVLAVFSTTAFAQVINDPMAQLRDLPDFHSVKVSGGLDLFISQDDASSVAVSAKSAEWREQIKTRVEDGVLVISVSENDRFFKKFGNRALRVYIGTKDIRKIDATGACDVRVGGLLKTEDLQLSLSGASDFYGEVDVERLHVSLNGASDAKIKGRAKKVDLEASGASSFNGYDLTSTACSAQASGASDIKITVTELLQPRASGASSIRYNGDAVIKDLKTSGASSVSKRT